MHESREQDEYQEPGQEHHAGIEHEARTNQRRHEPIPASSSSDKDQAAGGNQGQAASRPKRSPAPGQGDAVRDMIGGSHPQGDVLDAPATQIATADHEEDQASEQGTWPMPSRVSPTARLIRDPDTGPA